MTAPAVIGPRMTLADIRGPQYPVPGAKPQFFVDYVANLLNDSEEDAFARYKRATLAMLFADGRQWVDWTSRERIYKEQPNIEGQIRVTQNYLRPILRSRMQRMTSAELVWRAIPRSNAHEERDRATLATTFLKNRWDKTEMDSKTRAALWLAFLSAGSFYKTFWNPTIGPLTAATMILPHVAGLLEPAVDDQGQENPRAGQPRMVEYQVNRQGEPIHDEAGNPVDSDDAFRYRPGDTDTAVRSIFNVRVNPDAHGLEPDEGFRYLLDVELVPLSVVREKYGDRARKVSGVQGMSTTRNYERIVRSLSPQLGSQVGLLTGSRGKDTPDKESTLLVEYWEPPSDPMPNGRLIVTAGSEMLYPLEGEDDGLPQGIVPFVGIYDERRPFDAYSRGVTEDLIHPQKVINSEWSAILEDLWRQGIGQWVMFAIPGLSDQITNTNGAHIQIPTSTHLGMRPIGDIVQRLAPGAVSPDRWRLIQEAKATMFDIGSFHEIQRGQVPPGVDSGIAVQLLQEAENAQLHDPVRNLKRSLIRWGRHQLKYARWGYGEQEQRWIPVHRPDLGYLMESVKGTDLPDPDDIEIDLEGFRPTSLAATRADVKEFVKEGWIPPRHGLQLMDLGRGVEGAFESETRHYARARMENLALEKGEFKTIPPPDGTPTFEVLAQAFVYPDGAPFLLPTDDDHVTHIEVHQEIALDNSKPWPMRQAVLLHIAEHRLMLAQQAAIIEATEGAGDRGNGKPGSASTPRTPAAAPTEGA